MSRIVTDIDGVCLDYVEGFIEWVEEEYGWTINPQSERDTYNMSSWFHKAEPIADNTRGMHFKFMNTEEFIRLITEFNNYPRCLKPIKDSQEALAALKAQGHTIIALSSFGGSHATQEFRKAYLRVLFPGVFDDIILLDLGACKKEALAELNADYFIEDHKDHAETGAGLGIFTFLIRTSYNKGAQDVCHVEGWWSIEGVIRIRAGLAAAGITNFEVESSQGE